MLSENEIGKSLDRIDRIYGMGRLGCGWRAALGVGETDPVDLVDPVRKLN
jgi:hypothetical protein